MRVVVARSIDAALAALASATEASRILAGGTDLCVEFESGRTRPDLVVEVGRVAELRFVRETQAGLEIGAGSTCADLLRSAPVARGADLLALAAREVGAVQIQNRATLGGNLVTASPAADLVPALFALGARVRLASLAGRRELLVEEFVTGYRATARRPDELVESVVIPPRPAGEHRAFHKVGTRRAQSISKVVVALALGPRGAGARIAAGSVAERTLRLATLEAALARGLARERLAQAVAHAVALDTRPRDDVRSTARYRRAVLERVLVRVLGPWLEPEGNAA
ncbi:MAG: FAD binding domain-containing protein [Planctomycetes bacterium]|nr:FAD binding domain-containing protein [Planctomycetota bacterium]